MSKIKNQDAAVECIEYILDHEQEDYFRWCYFRWCEVEGKDPQDLSNPHIYAKAKKAFGEKIEVEPPHASLSDSAAPQEPKNESVFQKPRCQRMFEEL